MWRSFDRWQGLGLISIPLVVTLYFAVTGKLILFIHPRYVVFTVVMAIIGLILVAAAITQRVRNPRSAKHGQDDDHEHEHEPPPRRTLRGIIVPALASAIAITAALALLLLPAATLSEATAQQRAVNAVPFAGGPFAAVGTPAASSTSFDAATGTASAATFARFTVQEWSALLRQNIDLSFYSGKPVDVTGFIRADPGDPANAFYPSRFVISCCAVDAQPLGVPVSLPNWKSQFAAGQWLAVTGGFGANPSSSSTESIVLLPKTVNRVSEPAEPYLY